jgi:hypothetical protein
MTTLHFWFRWSVWDSGFCWGWLSSMVGGLVGIVWHEATRYRPPTRREVSQHDDME